MKGARRGNGRAHPGVSRHGHLLGNPGRRRPKILENRSERPAENLNGPVPHKTQGVTGKGLFTGGPYEGLQRRKDPGSTFNIDQADTSRLGGGNPEHASRQHRQKRRNQTTAGGSKEQP